MGHAFCQSHWRVKEEEVWHSWRNEPCFARVRDFYKAEAVQAKVVPTLKGAPYNSKLTSYIANVFIEDVLEVLPGVATRVDEWTLEYPLGSWTAYWKFLGTASLIRSVEEWWLYIEHYFQMRDESIPKDVALICMGLYDITDAQVHCGHSFIGSLCNLSSLKDFNLVDGFLNRCQENSPSLWSIIKAPPWFSTQQIYPHAFKMTREVYKAFVNEISTLERQMLINGGLNKVYTEVVA